MIARRGAGLALCVGFAALAFPSVASAHAFEIGRDDVPFSIWVFVAGAAGVLIVSFIALSIAWRTARFESDRWTALPPALSRGLINRWTEALCGAVGVGLLGVVVWSGLHGTQAPPENFSVTFVFITVWLGGVFVSVLIGNVYRAFNPWRAIARLGAFALRLATSRRISAPFSYPEWLGRWPAALGVVAFVWMELISGINGAGVTPHGTAVATLVYTGYTLCGMALFGIEAWVSNAEWLSVYLEMFSELSPFEVRDSRLGVRRPLAAAGDWAKVPGSIAVVVATIGTTAFDGAHEGVLQHPIGNVVERFMRLGLGLAPAARVADTIFLGLVIAVVAGIFWTGVWGMRTVQGSPQASKLGTQFAHSLIPIGLAYLIAHYFSYFYFGEQGQFGHLISNPLGTGTPAQPYVILLSSSLIWYVQVGTLVTGHVTGLALAHDKAITVYGGVKRASLSQRWMLLVMVAFTCLGLYLLSRANG